MYIQLYYINVLRVENKIQMGSFVAVRCFSDSFCWDVSYIISAHPFLLVFYPVLLVFYYKLKTSKQPVIKGA